MSSSVGRNSLIMASGTAASRLTGQIRTILLAGAVGTTGLAANAYQAGSMIPQVLFTLVSGGIFNAVLVPQIVRTLKQTDAEDRLNKLITFAITLLAGVTVLMALATPLLTMLYVGGDDDMAALTNAFTLWCMPQIFFYGLYTVVGQILAAKDRFGAYAWSSVGANVISCIGFTVFILLFGKADRQPIGFWTPDKLALTAGAWTLGVAFQALILFLPLFRCGIRFRPRWGIRGIGLKSMGPVAAWSLGVVVINQIGNIISTRIMTSAPAQAAALYGADQFDVAGNATYQNAYTLYILPYSLIAVSVATAMFPRVSQAVAEHRLDDARDQLGASLRAVGLLMMFFSVAFLVMPVPIIRALLPSVSVREAILMSRPLMAQGCGLALNAAYLIIQRTFYAFEDGKHPFMFMSSVITIQIIVNVGATFLLPPQYWVTAVGVGVTASYALSFPALIRMLGRRFEGHLGMRRIALTYGKGLLAAAAAAAAGLGLRGPVYGLLGIRMGADDGVMGWMQAFVACVILTIVITVVYVGVLWLLRTEELTSIVGSVVGRLRRRSRGAAEPVPEGVAAVATESTGDTVTNADVTQADVPEPAPSGGAVTEPVMPTPPASPVDTMSEAPHSADASLVPDSKVAAMTPQLGDTVNSRYVLVSSLRQAPGIQAWRANDQVLARDCQLFIVNDVTALPLVDAAASALAVSTDLPCTRVLQIRHADGALIVVTRLDAGVSIAEYLQGPDRDTLGYEAVRSIMGAVVDGAIAMRKASLEPHALSSDTVRLTPTGIQFADMPFDSMLARPEQIPSGLDAERRMLYELALLMFALLTRTAPSEDTVIDVNALPADVPDEFRLIIRRVLASDDGDAGEVPMLSLSEFSALLGSWTPIMELDASEIALPTADGACSITTVGLIASAQEDLAALPDDLVTNTRIPDFTTLDAAGQAAGTAGTASAAAGTSAAASGSGSLKALWAKSRELLDEGIDDGHDEDDEPINDADLFGDFDGGVPNVDGTRMTIPLDVAAVRGTADGTDAPTAVESTSQIPIVDADGTVIEPGSESKRALEEERAAIEATQRMQTATAPPSFTPTHTHAPRHGEPDTTEASVADQSLFGRFTTKTVAIVAVVVLIVAALALAIHGLGGGSDSSGVTQTEDNPWPELDLNDVPFGDDTAQKSGGSKAGDAKGGGSDAATGNGDQTSTKDQNGGAQASGQKADQNTDQNATDDQDQLVTAAKEAGQVPAPIHTNTTPYAVASQTFLQSPGGQNGYAYAIRLAEAQDVYRVTVSITTSGGQGHILVNTVNDPTAGEEVATFAFAEGGTTNITFNKVVHTQDLMLWIPADTLPGGQIYVNQIQVF